MRYRLCLMAVVAFAALAPGDAYAQRYRNSNAPIMTPDGPIPAAEYRLWASNPAAYEQMIYQRQMQMAQLEQQQMIKQQQAFEKWLKEQKAKKAKGQATDPQYDELMRMQEQEEARQKAMKERPKSRRARALAGKAKGATKSAAQSKTKAVTPKDAP
jgi:hypothetical protein